MIEDDALGENVSGEILCMQQMEGIIYRQMEGVIGHFSARTYLP